MVIPTVTPTPIESISDVAHPVCNTRPGLQSSLLQLFAWQGSKRCLACQHTTHWTRACTACPQQYTKHWSAAARASNLRALCTTALPQAVAQQHSCSLAMPQPGPCRAAAAGLTGTTMLQR